MKTCESNKYGGMLNPELVAYCGEEGVGILTTLVDIIGKELASKCYFIVSDMIEVNRALIPSIMTTTTLANRESIDAGLHLFRDRFRDRATGVDPFIMVIDDGPQNGDMQLWVVQ